MWETIVLHLEQIDQPTYSVSVRSVRDRYTLLARKFRERIQSEIKASGISPELSELDVLLKELIELEDLFEEEKQNESGEKKQER